MSVHFYRFKWHNNPEDLKCWSTKYNTVNGSTVWSKQEFCLLAHTSILQGHTVAYLTSFPPWTNEANVAVIVCKKENSTYIRLAITVSPRTSSLNSPFSSSVPLSLMSLEEEAATFPKQESVSSADLMLWHMLLCKVSRSVTFGVFLWCYLCVNQALYFLVKRQFCSWVNTLQTAQWSVSQSASHSVRGYSGDDLMCNGRNIGNLVQWNSSLCHLDFTCNTFPQSNSPPPDTGVWWCCNEIAVCQKIVQNLTMVEQTSIMMITPIGQMCQWWTWM